jgi:hypothetical protein
VKVNRSKPQLASFVRAALTEVFFHLFQTVTSSFALFLYHLQRTTTMSRPRSDASPRSTPTKHRSGFIRALSSFSKPVEEWGVSSVPVLSTSVTPRRERPSTTLSRRGSNSSRSTTSSPRRPGSVDAFESPSRVPAIRPLSIATISSFGDWMRERVIEHDGTEDAFTSQTVGTVTLKPPRGTYSQHGQPVAPVGNKYTIPKSPSASLAGSFRHGLDASTHPLRMHPPSPSLSARSIGPQSQSSSSLSQSPGKISLPSTPSFEDAASIASRETISTRRSRRTLAELNVKLANSDVKSREEELRHDDRRQAGVAQTDADPIGRHSSVPRDTGYVEAMRLWYEEKENKASDTRQRERTAARGAGTASSALASVNANHRL